MKPDPATPSRAEWLDRLLDLDDEDRARALADAAIPVEWREQGVRLIRLMDAPGLLDRDVGALAGDLLAVSATEGAGPGTEVGRYRLERLLGEGGMATVWLAAHRDEALPQRVAVKCMRAALATPEWRERFVREQRILARLSHPNITRLHDAGITAAGVPYIAMEYVDGLPITAHCDARGLDGTRRVRLFVDVCAAVAHAHRNLIVHRDLKPHNVLVDADGAVRLLDFGIAKLIDPFDSDADATRTGVAVLTPAYAAPEQFARGGITTATDVYGLGAVLHEMLTGARVAFHPDGRLQLPSARIVADSGVAVASGGAAALRGHLRGDLDAILERALRREPELRYASAAAFGDDLERWLAGEPVRARAGTFRYRAGKFVRRHALVFGLVTASALALSGLALYSWRESLRADRAAEAARHDAERNRVTRDFVIELMRSLGPGASPGTPTEQLDRGARRAHERFVDDPESLASILATIGELERGYGRLQAARTHIEEAAALALAAFGDGSPLWLDCEAQLGHTAFRESHYREGAGRLRGALERYDRAGGVSGPARIRALLRLGQLVQVLDERDTAARLLAEAKSLAERSGDPQDPLLQESLELYGEVLAELGRTPEAIPLLERNLALARAIHGDRDLAVVSALETLSLREVELGQFDAARARLAEAEATAGALLTGPHVIAAYVQNSRGTLELRAGHPEEAERHFQRALAIFSQLLVAPHAMLAATHGNLGESAFERADYAHAATEFAEAGRQRDALQSVPALVGLGDDCSAAEARARAGEARGALPEIDACVRRAESSPELSKEFLGGLEAVLADAQLRAGDVAAATRAAQAALRAPPATTLHERLQPLVVLARAAAAGHDRAALIEHARAALVVAGIRSRPCTVARSFDHLRKLVVTVGDEELARQLAARAEPLSCLASSE